MVPIGIRMGAATSQRVSLWSTYCRVKNPALPGGACQINFNCSGVFSLSS